MIDKHTDFFKSVDNFAKIAHVKSILVKKTRIESPLITIAIPTYKRADLLKETIESVLKQDYERGYEVLVVDNNPDRNDETEVLMYSYIGRDNISYYKNAENVGMVNNWNRLYELAQGKWVVLLHDDDMLCRDYLSSLIPFLKDEIGLYSCRHRILQNGRLSKSKNYKRIIEEISLIDFAWGDYIGDPVGVCMQKKMVIQIGGFNSDYYPTSDYCFFAFFIKNFKALMLNEQLAVYRIERNASFRREVLDGFMNNDYYLSCAIMDSCKIPSFIKRSIQLYRFKKQLRNLRKRWDPEYCYTGLEYSNSILICICSRLIYKTLYLGYVRIGKLLHWKYYGG